MLFSRPPVAALLPYVESLWSWREGAEQPGTKRTWLLPNGTMRLVFRFSPPLRALASERDGVGRTFGCTLVGGIRAQPYLRELVHPEHAVGAELRPGAGALLLGVPAHVLADHTRHSTNHVPLPLSP